MVSAVGALVRTEEWLSSGEKNRNWLRMFAMDRITYNEWIWGHGVVDCRRSLLYFTRLVQGRNSGSKEAYQDNKACERSTIGSNSPAMITKPNTHARQILFPGTRVFAFWTLEYLTHKHFQACLGWVAERLVSIPTGGQWVFDRRPDILLMVHVAGSMRILWTSISTTASRTKYSEEVRLSPFSMATSCRFVAKADTCWDAWTWISVGSKTRDSSQMTYWC